MTISKVTESDDFSQIVKLIYQTDDYIYPTMCAGDYAYFEEVMMQLLNAQSFFSYRNINVARIENDIAGIILSFTKEIYLPPSLKGLEERDCYRSVMADYFHHLMTSIDPDSLYVNNISVLKQYQNSGVGYKLMQCVITNSTKKKIILDCLADNTAGIALYEKCGFKIIDRFLGYAGDDADSIECLRFELIC